jgi:hypothetical protein
MGSIDCDPASSDAAQQLVQARVYYTQARDGLAASARWQGNVWLNPPYRYPLIAQFLERLWREHTVQHVPQAIILVNNATETKWFQTAMQHAQAACFPKGRIQFVSRHREASSPLQDQTFFYLGPRLAAFLKEFHPFGVCTAPLRYLHTLEDHDAPQ